MLDVRSAIQVASAFVAQMYNLETSSLLLEEVELTEDSNRPTWDITVSFRVPDPLPAGIEVTAHPFLLPQSRRVYKVVRVDIQDGQVLGMKIRELTGTT